MNPSPEQIRERVAAGAAWLDEKQPGWEARVNTERLNMESTCDCILGQVYEEAAQASDWFDWDFYEGAYWYVLQEHVGNRGSDWPVEHGFTLLGATYGDWAALEAAWVDLLKTRAAA
ncbi:MAG TPA: hypothetical protein VFV01_48000 [Spirillospora sp.]|nr:hypothetical protein [Spirillospora sp.]